MDRKDLLKLAEDNGIEVAKNIKTPKLVERLQQELGDSFQYTAPAVPNPADVSNAAADAANKVLETLPKKPKPAARIPSIEQVARDQNRMRTHTRRRVIVTCLNPKKAQWRGEIMSASNAFNGEAKLFVPFNNEHGWYVPQIVLNVLEARKFVNFREKRTERGNITSEAFLSKEFAIQYLPELTEEQVKELRIAQAQTNRVTGD